MKAIGICLALAVCAGSTAAGSDRIPAPPTPDKALELLIEGNRRYVADRPEHPHQGRVLRHELVVNGQHPFAAILSCADSRVPPELVFDEGLGDLFVVRVAGNIVDDAVLGSLEYAAEHLHVGLILVLGHTGCGAVTAAINGGEPQTHIEALTKAIQPAVKQARHEKGEILQNAVRDNVQLAVNKLRKAKPILRTLERAGKVRIVGAIYDMDSGTVEYLK